MKILDKQLIIMKLKSRFFDLIDIEEDYLKHEEVLKEMLLMIKGFFKVEEVTLLSSKDSKPEIYVEASTKDELISTCINPSIFIEEFKLLFSQSPIVRKSSLKGIEDYDLIVRLTGKCGLFGFLAIKGSSDCSCSDEFIMEIAEECSNFLEKAYKLCDVLFEEKRYKQLFRVTEKFHSTMKMDAVLEEIIETLQEVYPTFTYYLLLSHDNNGHGNLPIKGLEYDSENISAMQAYVTGLIQLEDSIQDRRSILYAPLKGKQGVYGVLQVIAPNAITFPKKEVEFITLLANTAGSALENAQLYQQSRRLISDLQSLVLHE